MEKIELLQELRRKGILREECPEPDFWRFSVLKPELLPQELEAEYKRFGEIRW